MKKKLLGMGPLLLMLLVLVRIAALAPVQAKSEEATPQPTQVIVDNFTFGPPTLTVPVNSTVTWVNKDDVPHVIASDNGLFKSKALDTDDKYSYTFTRPGTYPYYCSVHPKMVGKVIVR